MKAVLATVVAVSALALVAGPAAAATPPAFNNIPSTLPSNVVSVGFEATQTSEFGDYIVLGGTERSRAALPVTVVMSSHACQSDEGGGQVCTTTPGATFSQPLTLTIYAVDHSDPAVPAAGKAMLQAQGTFDIPYRPSFDPSGKCAALNSTGWWDGTSQSCLSGISAEVTFTLPAGPDLPDELIWTISFDTGSSGYSPTGNQSKPYNSLNVSAETDIAPSPGAEGDPDGLFLNSRNAGMYGSGASVGTFGFTTGWGANKPMSCFGISCTANAPVPSESVPAVTPAPSESILAVTPTPSESILAVTPTPSKSIPAVTPAPSESIEGETAVPHPVTPPPTSTGDSSGTTSGSQLALILCAAFAGAALIAVRTQRRSLRR
jgi:hypothetical protein